MNEPSTNLPRGVVVRCLSALQNAAGARYELAGAIWTRPGQLSVGAALAEGALEAADPRIGSVCRQIHAAPFACRSHLEHPRLLSTRRKRRTLAGDRQSVCLVTRSAVSPRPKASRTPASAQSDGGTASRDTPDTEPGGSRSPQSALGAPMAAHPL
jgi:hypothetical protein